MTIPDATEAWESAYHREFVGPIYDKELAEREKECFKAGFAAGQVAALEDAAEEIDAAANPDQVWQVADSIRARAAELRGTDD